MVCDCSISLSYSFDQLNIILLVPAVYCTDAIRAQLKENYKAKWKTLVCHL